MYMQPKDISSEEKQLIPELSQRFIEPMQSQQTEFKKIQQLPPNGQIQQQMNVQQWGVNPVQQNIHINEPNMYMQPKDISSEQKQFIAELSQRFIEPMQSQQTEFKKIQEMPPNGQIQQQMNVQQCGVYLQPIEISNDQQQQQQQQQFIDQQFQTSTEQNKFYNQDEQIHSQQTEFKNFPEMLANGQIQQQMNVQQCDMYLQPKKVSNEKQQMNVRQCQIHKVIVQG